MTHGAKYHTIKLEDVPAGGLSGTLRAWVFGSLLAVLIWVPSAVLAAESNLSDLSRVMRRWGVDEGLTGTRVERVVQTASGHLWVGAEDGLFRFNGRKFERLETESIPEIGIKWVTRMCLSREGDLWLGFHNRRLAVLRDGQFAAVTIPGHEANLEEWWPHPEGGVIALNRSAAGVALFHLDRAGSETLLEPVAEPIISAWAARDGRVWVGLAGAAVAEVRDGALIRGEEGAAPDTGVFLERRDGSLLAIGRHGIFERSGDAWQERVRFVSPPGNLPRHAAEDRDRRVWFGGQQGDRMVWEEGKPPRQLRSNSVSLPAVIQSAIADANGDLWYATFSGLYQARYVPFITWKPPIEMPTERVVTVHARPDGTIWFNGIASACRLSPEDLRPALGVLLTYNDMAVCDADDTGAIWIGNRQGRITRIRGGESAEIPVKGVGRSFSPAVLVVDHDGVVWCSSHSDVIRCDPRREPLQFEKVSGANGLPEDECHHVRVLSNGDLLIAARRYGVFQLPRGQTEWELVTPQADAEAQLIRTMDRDSEGRIWGYVERLGVLGCWGKTAGVKTSLANLGLGDKAVRGIALDDVGHLWFTTRNHGVGMASCDELLAAMEGRAGQPVLTWFDQKDGLGSIGGTYGAEGIAKGPDGRLWVATDGGLSVIDPGQWLAERGRAAPINPRIEACMADGKPMPLESPVRIPAGTVSVGIRFSALDFGFPGEIRYRHRLRGRDDSWIDDDSSDEAFLQQLPPGDFEFEVMAANRFGIWSEKPAHLLVRMLPHWWQRTGVRVGSGLGLLLGLGLLFHMRLRALRASSAMHEEFSRRLIVSQEEERRRIAGEIHDSLGQNLLIAKNQLYLARQLERPDAVQEKLAQVGGSVDAALNEARAISHRLRPFQLERLGLAKAMRAVAREASESTRIPIEARIDSVDGLLPADAETMLFRMLQEALSNVIKHADASKVMVSVTRAGAFLRMKIEDDGRGFDAKATLDTKRGRHGLGLVGFKERVHLLNGTFHCQSAPGEGTVLTFDIPIPDSAP